ncbi:MAG: trypsin-like serine protease [Actinomycetaceae bacterium]|nr:trypsin-like serine protease [Actinomycetaceae bacterium]
MNIFRKACAALAAACALGIPAMTPQAHAISGGEEASSPYIVQLRINHPGQEKQNKCTGSLLNDSWVVTAAHCAENTNQDGIEVYVSNNKANPGEKVLTDRIELSPSADLALLHLSTPKQVSEYAHLTAGHQFKEGEEGYIYGFGRGFEGKDVTWLRRAHVRVIGEGTDSYWQDTYRLKGLDGTSNHGDSGGPFLIGDELVGINVTGSHTADYYIHENSGSLQLTPHLQWIHQTMGM